ncbi:MAG TPA: SusC/RagA family TonB-linked outer membrane protein, partial [Sphingobacteriaceae bacterium]
MRFLFLIGFLTLSGILQANSLAGQDLSKVIVSLQLKNETLRDAFRQIEKKSPVRFTYKSQDVLKYKNISYYQNDQKLTEVLNELLKNTDLTYEVLNNVLVIKKVQESDISTGSAYSLPVEIRGRVTGEDGEALIGVSIKVKGTNIGASTDANGQFSLSVPEGNNTLVITYIGYVTQEIVVNDQTSLNIRLLEDSKSLDEVVVVGYGTAKRSSVTAAISKIENKILDQVPSARPETALVGRLAGVNVSTNRSRPGDAPVIRVRGAGSITASNDPLIVIDGFAGGSFNNVNMNDVQSIEVLKDASSAAIYGSRGSGGVIIVTTKKGRLGKPQLNFNAYAGIANAIGHDDWISGQEFYDYVARYQNREFTWAGGDASIPLWGDSRRPAGFQVNPVIKEGNTNWQSVLLNSALLQNYNLSVGGGSDNVNYYVSGALQNEEGTLMNTGYKKYSLRANLNLKINSVISTGFMLNPNFSTRRTSPNSIEALVKTAPFVSKDRRPDGTYPKPLDYWGTAVSGQVSPLATLEGTSNTSNA